MPRKIRELVRDLLDAGFEQRPGKGSHVVFKNPDTGQVISIARPHGSEKHVRRALVVAALKLTGAYGEDD